MSNILVTGGAGYIGSNTCKALAQAGFTPVAYDSLEHGHEWAVQWGPFVKGDIRDGQKLDDVFKQFQPAAVIHFAAYAYVGESMTQPARYYDNNVVGTLSLLQAMQRHGCDKIVFSSTCATYGHPETVPITEDTPQHPINPYGMTKLAVEQMLTCFGMTQGLQSIALRYFNAAGADADGEIGEAHDPETHLIPLVLDVAAKRRTQIRIFGTDYATRDGSCIRDYIHVSDLADAHVLSLQHLLRGGESRIYNVGVGKGYSVLEVVRAAEQVTGVSIPAEYAPRRSGDPAALVASAAAIRQDLGWLPRHSDLPNILGTAWRWHQKQHIKAESH
jgi:UDP-arabinose 4-epimerase